MKRSSASEDRVPLITLPNWVRAAAACGFSIGEVYEELGIEADLLHAEQSTVSGADIERTMVACVARSRRRHFPFALGESFGFEYMPELDTFLTTSPTLRESARVFEWLRVLINPHLRLQIQEHEDVASLRLDWQGGGRRDVFHWFVEATFVSVLKFGRALLQGRGDFRRATFQAARPDYAVQAREVLGLPLAFGQAHNALEIDRRLLDLPLRGAFETLHRQAEQLVARRLSERTAVVESTAQVLERLMERRPALLGRGIEAAAEALALHPRTLQRRLAQEQVSFGDLQAGLRLRLAKGWLADPALDIETVSERLGFADRRSFTRAFARWTGTTPSRFRRT